MSIPAPRPESSAEKRTSESVRMVAAVSAEAGGGGIEGTPSFDAQEAKRSGSSNRIGRRIIDRNLTGMIVRFKEGESPSFGAPMKRFVEISNKHFRK